MLLDEFRMDNMNAVAEIVLYFENDINDKNHVGLWPVEQVLLYYWIEEYGKIIDYADKQLDDTPTFRNRNWNRNMVYPTDNSIYYEVVSASMKDFDFLTDKIREQNFFEDEEQFLILLLERILAEEDPAFISMDQVNKEADRFMADFPDSPMTEIVKEHISYKLGIGDWVFGIYFGGGYTIPSGKMLDYVSSKGAICASFDLFYKRSALMLSVQSGFGSAQQDIPVNNYGYWEKGSSSELTSIGLALGFSAFDNVKFRVTPFAGVSFGSTGPSGTDLDRALEKFSIGTSTAPMFGLNMTYRFINLNKTSNSLYPFSGSYGINARITYVPSILKQEGYQYAGNIWYLTIGLNMDMFNFKKI